MKLFILLILASFSFQLHAVVCASPNGKPGMMTFVAADNEYKYCDNTGTWISMSSGESLQFNTTCSTAGLISGAQFCNGTKFVNMDSQGNTGASCTTENELKYNSVSGTMLICINGSYNDVGYCGSCNGGMVVNNCSGYKNSTTCYANNCDWNGTQCVDLPTTGGPPSSSI